jgi:RimJ/RimL family protein N-acetyltransferase
MGARFEIELPEGAERLRAYEPSMGEVAAAARRLAGYYNEPHNRSMLSHTEALSHKDVVDHYRSLAAEGGRPFLLEVDGALVGDADLRRIEDRRAEVAILVGDRSMQGKGLGLRFGVMLHAFAFRVLELERLYASIIPANRPSLRLFEKLGYQPDDGPAARRYADEPDDVTLSLTPAHFDELHGVLARQVRCAPRVRP